MDETRCILRRVNSLDWNKLWRTIGGRKFVGFVIASIFMVCGLISDVVWLSAFAIYAGANVAQKVLAERRDTSADLVE